MAIGAAAVIIPAAVQGAIELAKLAMEVLETWSKNPADQAELDARFDKMKAARGRAIDAWEASKQGG